MKIKDSFIQYESDGESMLIPTSDASFSGLVKGNPTLGVIMKLLSEDTTEDEVVDKMLEKYDAPREVISADVHKAITELRKIGAIDD